MAQRGRSDQKDFWSCQVSCRVATFLWSLIPCLILSIQSASTSVTTPCLNNDPLSAQSTSLPRLSRLVTGPDVPVSATKDGLLSTKKSR